MEPSRREILGRVRKAQTIIDAAMGDFLVGDIDLPPSPPPEGASGAYYRSALARIRKARRSLLARRGEVPGFLHWDLIKVEGSPARASFELFLMGKELDGRDRRGDSEAIFDAVSILGHRALGLAWVGLKIDRWRDAAADESRPQEERTLAVQKLRRVGEALATVRGSGRTESDATKENRAFVREHLPVLRAHLRALRQDPRAEPPESLLAAGFGRPDLESRQRGVGPYDLLAARLGLSVDRIKRLAAKNV